MYLVQVLLPLYDNEGVAFPAATVSQVRRELTDRFGGLTAFTRAPAEGLWKDGDKTVKDAIVVLEVMSAALDHAWWANYRRTLESTFRQDTVVIRAQPIEVL